MQVSIRVPPFAPVPEVTRFTQRCEEAGFDGVGFIDSQMITRDVFVVLAHAAAATSRVRLVPAVTNPQTRHVSVLASAARSLADLAPDRVEIWFGRGFSSTNMVGLPQATTAQLRRTIEQYRGLLAGDWDVFPGAHTHMYSGDRTQVPIVLAASGPKTLRLGGELADGVVMAVGGQPGALLEARRHVEEGAQASGRPAGSVRLIACVPATIREDREEARAWAAPMAAHHAGDADWLRAMGIEADPMTPPEELINLYPDFFHAEDWDRALELAKFLPDDLRAQLCDATGIIGTPDDAVQRLRELDAAGFDEVFLMTVGTMNFPEAEMEAFAETIGPALAAEGARGSRALSGRTAALPEWPEHLPDVGDDRVGPFGGREMAAPLVLAEELEVADRRSVLPRHARRAVGVEGADARSVPRRAACGRVTASTSCRPTPCTSVPMSRRCA